MAAIPEEALVMILSWLPFRTLSRFKCVCKAWLLLITTDFFLATLHCDRVLEGTVGRYKYKLGSLINNKSDEQDFPDLFRNNVLRKNRFPRLATTVRHFVIEGHEKPLMIDLMQTWETRHTDFMRTWEIRPCKYKVYSQVQTWAERTAILCRSILQKLDYGRRECQVLVLAPTIGVVQRIEEYLHALNYYIRIKNHACGGGTSFEEDQNILLSGVHVVVGTPNCVFSMLQQQTLHLDHIKMVIIDEANTMLSEGLANKKVSDLCFHLPYATEVGIFSTATTFEVLKLGLKVYIGDSVMRHLLPQCEVGPAKKCHSIIQ